MGGSWGGWVRKVKGLRSTNWQLQNSHGDKKYTLRHTVSNIVVTKYGARCLTDLSGGSLCKLYKCLTTMRYT